MTVNGMDCVVRGDAVWLRRLRRDDAAGSYHRWMNDPQVTRFLESRFRSWSVAELEAYIDKESRDASGGGLFGIVRGTDDAHLGNIKLGPVNRAHQTASIGLLIGEDNARGKGYGTQALHLIAQYAFCQLGLHKLTAGIYANNIASLAAFRKAGFVEEGLQRQQWLDQGVYVDGVLVGLLRREWQQAAERSGLHVSLRQDR